MTRNNWTDAGWQEREGDYYQKGPLHYFAQGADYSLCGRAARSGLTPTNDTSLGVRCKACAKKAARMATV